MLGRTPDAEAADRVLEALSHSFRRRLLFELYEAVHSAGSARITYTDIPLFSSEYERSLLYHVHLPKLEEFGYISWEESSQTIQTGPQWEEVEPLLGLIHDHLDELPPFLRGTPDDREAGSE